MTPRSTSREAICRPGESVSLDLDLRAVARGTAPIDPAYAAITSRGFMERIATAGNELTLHVLPNLRAVGRLHKQLNSYALRSLGARTAPRIGKGRLLDPKVSPEVALLACVR